MKRIINFLFLFSIISCTPKSLPTVFEVREGYAVLKASHEITQSELNIVQKELSQLGFVLDYDKSLFFEDGKIQRLSLTVQTPEGAIGSVSADLVTLQYKYYGFKYDKESETLLYLGIMK